MNKILAMREKRGEVWDKAKAFLNEHQDENGMLSPEDAAQYERMEQEVVDLGHAIEREERAARRERLGVTEPEKPASQVGNRRYARGRAYVEDRFVNPEAAEEATRAAAAESEFGESIDTEVAEEEVVETAAPAAVDEGAAPVDESEEEGFVEESFIDEDEDEDQENKR